MARYHLKDDGNPGLCRAEEGKCPKGGAHFSSQEEARAAVEQLFGGSFAGGGVSKTEDKSLPVYTKDAVRGQFGSYLDPRDGTLLRFSNEGTLFLDADAWTYVSDARRLILESRLDVKAQNARVREALEDKLQEWQTKRSTGAPRKSLRRPLAFTTPWRF